MIFTLFDIDQGREPEQVLASTKLGEWTPPWPAVLRWDAPRSRAILVLDPFTRGATSGVLDPWTAPWNRRFSGGSQESPGVDEAGHRFPPRTRWVVGADPRTQTLKRRARNRIGPAVSTFPHPPRAGGLPEGRGAGS